jgi:ABC-2 type transport system ATP-binding protein
MAGGLKLMAREETMVTASGVYKYYGLFPAVRGVSFDLHPGEVLGFLGPNGAGKTTMMKILTCFLSPTSGSVRVKGFDVSEDPLKVRSLIGYLPENAPLYPDMTVLGFLRFCGEIRGFRGADRDRRVGRVADQVGVTDRLLSRIGELSKGLRQRVGLGQAILADPEILILDEPTSGLDPNQIVEIRNIIKDLGKTKTVILSTHILPEVELTCDRAIIVNRGRVAADGSLEQLRAEAAESVRYRIAFGPGASGTPAEHRAALEGVSGVARVDSTTRPPRDEPAFWVEADGDDDLAPALAAAARDRGWPLLELHREIPTLEQVFVRLTQVDPAASEEEGVEASEDGGEETGAKAAEDGEETGAKASEDAEDKPGGADASGGTAEGKE